MNKIILKTCLLLICLSQSGCYATKYALDAGVRHEGMDHMDDILLSKDGSIAISYAIGYYNGDVIPTYGSYKSSLSFIVKRYLVASPETVAKLLTDAIQNHDKQSEEEKKKEETYRKFKKANGSQVPLAILNMNIEVTYPEEITGWKWISTDFAGRDDTKDQLPIVFHDSPKRYDDMIPYTYQDSFYIINFDYSRKYKSQREQRLWWGYPAMIFVIPAIPFDIATSPVQLLISFFSKLPKFN